MSVVEASTVVEPFGGLFTEVITGRAYLISYNEDLWKSLSEESRQFCKDTWIKKATPTEARWVVLKLVPDDLFPMHGHEKPYVEWQHEIDRPPECGFSIAALATVHVDSESKYVDPVMRADITRALKGFAGVPHYKIVNKLGDVVETGAI